MKEEIEYDRQTVQIPSLSSQVNAELEKSDLWTKTGLALVSLQSASTLTTFYIQAIGVEEMRSLEFEDLDQKYAIMMTDEKAILYTPNAEGPVTVILDIIAMKMEFVSN